MLYAQIKNFKKKITSKATQIKGKIMYTPFFFV